MLSKIDGGEVTQNYINKKILDIEKKITGYDLMMYRLNKIFEQGTISSSIADELKNLFGNDKRFPSSYIVRLSYLLEMVYSL